MFSSQQLQLFASQSASDPFFLSESLKNLVKKVVTPLWVII